MTHRTVTAALLLLALAPVARALPVDRETMLATCDDAVTRHPESLESYTCYGFLAVRHDMWEMAIARLEALVAARPDDPHPMGALAYLDSLRGDPRAERLLRRILAIYDAQPDPPAQELLWTLQALASYLIRAGAGEEAVPLVERAMVAARASGDPELLGHVAISQSELAWAMGDHDLGLRLLRDAERSLRKTENPYVLSSWFSQMGAHLFVLGQFERARAMYEQQANLLRRIGDLHEEASVRYNIALIERALFNDDWTSVARHPQLFRAALEAARSSGNRQVEAKCLIYLAQTSEDGTEARRLASAALEIAKEGGWADVQEEALLMLAHSFASQEPLDARRATDLAERAVRLAETRGSPVELASAEAVRAALAWLVVRSGSGGEGARRAAIEASLDALESVTREVSRQRDPLDRARRAGERSSVYESLAGNLLLTGGTPPDRDSMALAVRTMERKRARVLLEQMNDSGVSRAIARLDDRELERERLFRVASWLEGRLRALDADAPARREIEAQLASLTERDEALRAELSDTGSPLANLRDPEIPGLDRIAAALRPDEAILSFQVGDEGIPDRAAFAGSWLMVHTATGTKVYRLAPRAQLDGAVDLLLGALARRSRDEVPGTVNLYELLLSHALEDLPPEIERLVVVPDGSLARLPFGTLRPARGAPPLASRFTISYVPSITLWYGWRSRSAAQRRGTSALVLADPGADATDPDGGGSAWRGAPRLPRLPGARAEGRFAARTGGGGSRLLEGRRATEEALFAADMAPFSLLHIAAHLVADDRRPGSAAVMLAAGGRGADGRLTPAEIASLDLRGTAVVLAGCRGASGELLQGEGVLSLARPFLIAGAPAVVASLLPLRDDDAERYFRSFYEALGRGRSLARAARAASDAQRAAGLPASTWAPVIVIGDGSFTPFPGGARSAAGWWLPALALAALLAGAWWSWRRRLPHPETGRTVTRAARRTD